MQRDPTRLPQLLAHICGLRAYPDNPDALSVTQRRTILTEMGATALEVAEILRRIGVALDT